MSKEKQNELLINDVESNNSEVISNKQIEEMCAIMADCSYRCCEDTPLIPESCGICDRVDCHRCKEARLSLGAGYRKQSEGEWTKHLDEWDCEYAKCSCCGEEFYDASGEDTIDMFYNFCPNCGAKMKGGAE